MRDGFLYEKHKAKLAKLVEALQGKEAILKEWEQAGWGGDTDYVKALMVRVRKLRVRFEAMKPIRGMDD